MYTVGLFVPCYIDQFYPQVAISSLQLLVKLGCKVVVPLNQTCCGQPMANSGFASLSKGCDANFIQNFGELDYIVCPSGSCTLHIKEHLHSEQFPEKATQIQQRIYELTEFLTDVLNLTTFKGSFRHRVGLHNSCHGQRGLHLSSMSELVAPVFSKPADLLKRISGLELVVPERSDECCGFGGTFCVFEEAVSVKMGKDRITEHEQNQVEILTGGDMSCLMHLEGILKRKKSPVRVMHIAEILNAGYE
ncbi:(Fe-S)-binding protein [Flavihumibacter sp. RY-1]|uniref:(Fe-S)-binding protein n=1 Tax=Flavihumibacter fluminis TaxID=2909236 RepID=A0ABS9BJ68_9BACT|nr:(Fe-S)-binding protein [Flavihumibacter fluminis]MCF1715761.1 (Fe-S)-binding protein [Flavihumibacter fluminis]